MDNTLFYTLGIILVASAVIVSIIGLRYENFPQSRGILFGVLAYFAALVAATATFAVRNANVESADQASGSAENAKISNELSSGGTTTPATTTSSGSPT